MPVKVAIIGYGRNGSTMHADPIEKLEDFTMEAVCDIDPSAREKASRRFGCRVYEDYMQMLEKETLDLVVIVTRSDQHCKMACDCLKAGVNVLVTKPWAKNTAEAEELIRTSKDTGKMLLPWAPARWGCDLLKLKELIGSGIIGKVFQVRRSEFTFGVRNDWQTLRKCAGGYLLNWGPHLLDQPLQLLGTRVRSVYGKLRQVINPGDVEDVFYSVLNMEDGVTVVSEYNISAKYLPNWVVQGDRGTIFVKGTYIEIHKTDLPDTIDPESYRNTAKIEVITEDLKDTASSNRYGDSMVIYPLIAKTLQGEPAYNVSLDSALNLTRVLDAIRQSDATGEIVHMK